MRGEKKKPEARGDARTRRLEREAWRDALMGQKLTHNLKEGEKEEEKTEEEKIKEEVKWIRDTGRWVVCVNRDALIHGAATDQLYLKEVKRSMLSTDNLWQMLHLEFDDLDQQYIEICNEIEVLWEMLGMEEIFFETPETWKKALEALQRDIDDTEALNSKKVG